MTLLEKQIIDLLGMIETNVRLYTADILITGLLNVYYLHFVSKRLKFKLNFLLILIFFFYFLHIKAFIDCLFFVFYFFLLINFYL